MRCSASKGPSVTTQCILEPIKHVPEELFGQMTNYLILSSYKLEMANPEASLYSVHKGIT